MIRNVVVFRNGMVAVFDMNGEQIPEYQGPKEEVWRKLMIAVIAQVDAGGEAVEFQETKRYPTDFSQWRGMYGSNQEG